MRRAQLSSDQGERSLDIALSKYLVFVYNNLVTLGTVSTLYVKKRASSLTFMAIYVKS